MNRMIYNYFIAIEVWRGFLCKFRWQITLRDLELTEAIENRIRNAMHLMIWRGKSKKSCVCGWDTLSSILNYYKVKLSVSIKEDDFGFIATPNSGEFYFNASNVVHSSF